MYLYSLTNAYKRKTSMQSILALDVSCNALTVGQLITFNVKSHHIYDGVIFYIKVSYIYGGCYIQSTLDYPEFHRSPDLFMNIYA